MMARKLSSETWRDTLDKNAPWWGGMVDAAIAHLSGPLPESHGKKELKENRLSWSSEDSFLNALQVIDDVLAIDAVPPFDKLQGAVVDVIASKWDEWPLFTRAAALSCLRPWYWCTFPRLRALLTTTLARESNPALLRYAVARLIYANPASEIPEFVRRAAAGGHGDSLRTISELLGDAVARKHLPSPSGRVSELEGYYRRCIAFTWPNAEALSDFLSGALVGIVARVQSVNAQSNEVWQAWIKEIDQAVALWPFSAFTDEGERFPIHVLLKLFRNDVCEEERTGLFVGLASTFETVLRSGDLPSFCALHHDLKGLLVGSRRFSVGLPMNRAVENVLPLLARASVERVATWKKEGKVTKDWGWQSGVDGRDSAELVKCCLDVSRDRSRMLASLAALPDILANAGYLSVAADLRAYLRNT